MRDVRTTLKSSEKSGSNSSHISSLRHMSSLLQFSLVMFIDMHSLEGPLHSSVSLRRSGFFSFFPKHDLKIFCQFSLENLWRVIRNYLNETTSSDLNLVEALVLLVTQRLPHLHLKCWNKNTFRMSYRRMLFQEACTLVHLWEFSYKNELKLVTAVIQNFLNCALYFEFSISLIKKKEF